MELNLKLFNKLNTQANLRWKWLLIVLAGWNTNWMGSLKVRQKLSLTQFAAHQLINKDSRKIVVRSIYDKLTILVTSVVLFAEPNKELYFLIWKDFLEKFKNTSLHFGGLKLNKKFYSPYHLAFNKVLAYMDNNLFFFQSSKIYIKYFRITFKTINSK